MGYLINESQWNGANVWEDDEPDIKKPASKRASSGRRGSLELVGAARRESLVLAVEDQIRFSPGLQTICEFLGVKLEQVNSYRDLMPLLKVHRPMAVFCELDSPGQDGCHVMKIVAEHDRTLPVLVVTGGDPSLLGAAQAVEEIFHLTGVVACQRLPAIGELVESCSPQAARAVA